MNISRKIRDDFSQVPSATAPLRGSAARSQSVPPERAPAPAFEPRGPGVPKTLAREAGLVVGES